MKEGNANILSVELRELSIMSYPKLSFASHNLFVVKETVEMMDLPPS